MKIVTEYDPKPIPRRDCDWTATYDDYEPGDPIGLGETEERAIEDLKIMAELYEDDNELRFQTEMEEIANDTPTGD